MDNQQQRIERAMKLKQERIDKATKEKYARLDKTAVSILVSWAFNCAVAVMGEFKDTDGHPLIEKAYCDKLIQWRDWFIEKYQEEMLNRLEVPKTDMSEWQEDYNKLSALDDIKAEDKTIEK